MRGGRRLNLLWPLHNLPALQAWFTFDDPAYLKQDAAMTSAVTADGDPIGAALDRSGNSRHVVQDTTSAKPTWKTSIRNGRAVARLDGGDWLANVAPGALLRNVGGATLVVVLQTTLAGSIKHVMVVSTGTNAASARCGFSREATGAGTIRLSGRRLDADSLQMIEAAGAVTGQWGVQSGRVDYAHSDAWLYNQGAEIGTTNTWSTDGATSDTDALSLGVGALSVGTAPITGDVAECIICGADIGLPLLQRLWREYLGPKWGLAL